MWRGFGGGSEEFMTDQEKRDKEMKEFESQCKIRVAELDEYFKTHKSSDVKTREESGKYWHLRMEHVQCSHCMQDGLSMAEWDLDLMKLCIECLEHSKQLSPEMLKRWASYWACFVSDVFGEANCKIGTPYYPRYGKLAEGKEKEEWQEVVDLGCKFWELYPKE